MTADPPPGPVPRPPTPPDTTSNWLGDEADYQRWIRDTPMAQDSGATGATGSARRFDDLVLTESSLAESSLVATSRSAVAPIPGAGTRPVWSERDGQWLLRDRRHGRWYRHDPTTDQWLPLDGA